MRTRIKELLNEKNTDKFLEKSITVCGWIRSCRAQKTFCFIELNDGSTLSSIQIILDHSHKDYKAVLPKLTTGASIKVIGKAVKSPAKGQAIEIHAEQIEICGLSDPSDYPLQKKRHSFEFLRTISHLRPRTNTQGAILRTRSALSHATHLFFQTRGFIYIHTPILTGSDCEGGGELFQVNALKDGKQNDNFFGKPAYLTVSGQLNAETIACAMGDVYTFGPTFRAENSHTSRHLAEFWMIEPEMAFCDLMENKQVAEEYIKYCLQYLFDNNMQDLEFFDKFIEKGLIDRLQHVLNTPFHHLTYTEAIDILKKSNKKFEFSVSWGIDLQSEHERYLAEDYCKGPVVVTDYPKEIKAFYMRLNDDEKTVRALDILMPKIGELVGGSQREERISVLEENIKKLDLKREEYEWYFDIRKYGTVPHSGFGLGLERLILFVTGMENIRDVIPFPRYPGHVEF